MNIILYRLPQFAETAELTQVKTLRFQRAEEVLHHRIIQTVPFARHTLRHPLRL